MEVVVQLYVKTQLYKIVSNVIERLKKKNNNGLCDFLKGIIDQLNTPTKVNTTTCASNELAFVFSQAESFSEGSFFLRSLALPIVLNDKHELKSFGYKDIRQFLNQNEKEDILFYIGQFDNLLASRLQ